MSLAPQHEHEPDAPSRVRVARVLPVLRLSRPDRGEFFSELSAPRRRRHPAVRGACALMVGSQGEDNEPTLIRVSEPCRCKNPGCAGERKAVQPVDPPQRGGLDPTHFRHPSSAHSGGGQGVETLSARCLTVPRRGSQERCDRHQITLSKGCRQASSRALQLSVPNLHRHHSRRGHQ